MLDKEQIIAKLRENHQEFTSMIGSLPEKDFVLSKGGKWTPGQQAEHIRKSVGRVKLAFSLPKFMLKLLFGKSNRPSKTIEALSFKYKTKLSQGGKASSPYIPGPVPFSRQQSICKAILAANKSIIGRLDHFSEEALDTFILPHPLLGKVTLREMLYFNIIHVKHHFTAVNQLLGSNAG